MSVFIRYWLVIFLILLLPISPVVCAERYLVGVDEMPAAPYSWVEHGLLRGAQIDLLQAFAKHQEVELFYLPIPYTRAVQLVAEGKIDVIYPDDRHWGESPKKGLALDYSEAAFRYRDGLFMLEHQIDRAKPWKVGVLLGWMPTSLRDEIEQGSIQIVRCSNLDRMLNQLLTRQLDAVYMTRGVLERYLEQHSEYSRVVFVEELPSFRGAYRMSSVHHPELLEAFNRFIKEQPAVIEDIRQRYQLPEK